MRWTALLLVLLCAATFASEAKPRRAKPVQKSITLPVTTSSPAARKEFDRAMVDLELLRRPDALDDLRRAVKRDPKFAQAHILISHLAPQRQTLPIMSCNCLRHL